jgi:hypothetical protein
MMSKMYDAAARIKAAIDAEDGRKRVAVRREALTRELNAFLAPIAHEPDARKAQQADLWLGAVRAHLNDLGDTFTMEQSDSFFIDTFGDAAAAIVAAHKASAAAWADELAGCSPIDALPDARATMEDEVRGAKSAAWN